MAATGYTPILIYASGTASNQPSASNLTSSANGAELALNYADGKLYYKDSSNNVQLLASKSGASGDVVGPASATDGNLAAFDGTTGKLIKQAATVTTTQGGTGLSSYTAGDVTYYSSGTTLSKLPIGSANQIMTSSGTAPQWTTLSGVAVTTFSGGTTGLTPATATSGAVTLSGTLAVANGGTGASSLTANNVILGNGTSAVQAVAPGTSGNVLTSDGTTWTSAPAAGGISTGKSIAMAMIFGF